MGLPTEPATQMGKPQPTQKDGVVGIEDDDKAKTYLKKHNMPFKDYAKALKAVRKGEE